MSSAFDVALGIGISLVPFYLGLALTILTLRGRTSEAAAVALGASVFLFVDPIRDTNGLGGFAPNYGLANLSLIAAFSLAFLLLTAAKGKGEVWPIWVVTTAIAIHTFAETSELAGSIPAYMSDPSAAIQSGSSFVLHKVMEGFVLGAYALSIGSRLSRAALGSTPMVIIATAGSFASLLPTLDLDPLLAAGAGGWLFVLVVFGTRMRGPIRPAALALILLGLIIVYSVGVLHSG